MTLWSQISKNEKKMKKIMFQIHDEKIMKKKFQTMFWGLNWSRESILKKFEVIRSILIAIIKGSWDYSEIIEEL